MDYPAIALIEFNSIATGTTAADAMVKKAPIEIVRVGTIQRGKFLVLIGGSVAAVTESFREGLGVGEDTVVDKVLLPEVHPTVRDAVLGKRQLGEYDALGLIETANVAAVIEAADAAVKGALVKVMEIRLGDGLGGKGIAYFTGKVHDVQAAIEIGVARIRDRQIWIRETVIPSLHEDMVGKVGDSTRFRPVRSKE